MKKIKNTIYYTTDKSKEELRWTLLRPGKLTPVGAARIIKRKIGNPCLVVFVSRIEIEEV